MSSIVAILFQVLFVIFSICFLFAGMIFGIPKFMDWLSVNVGRDYLENRAERKVRDLRSKLRVIELEAEALKLEKSLEERKGMDS